jgi:uncharacterized repeat protein (TIGR03803 family)
LIMTIKRNLILFDPAINHARLPRGAEIVHDRSDGSAEPRGVFMFPLSSSRVTAFLLATSAIALSSAAHAATTFTSLYSFKGGSSDGVMPESRLIADKHGNLYGTTQQNPGASDFGTIYEVQPNGTESVESVLYTFQGGTAGAEPNNGLLLNQHGDFYGGTGGGGKANLGLIFELKPAGDLKALYSCPNPKRLCLESPNGDLIEDSAGNFYGTGGGGTASIGVIFEMAPDRTVTVLHDFQGGDNDGSGPFSGLVADASGTMYGTTTNGGTANLGVLYSWSASAGFNVIYSFLGHENNDGAGPLDAPVLDSSGNFWGVTISGGSQGLGTVYEVMANGQEKILHNFVGGTTDGKYPYGRLIFGANGDLYGVTGQGGANNMGTVFQIGLHGGFKIVHSFSGTADGSDPIAGLYADAHGNYYGTTLLGGANGDGTVFEIRP